MRNLAGSDQITWWAGSKYLLAGIALTWWLASVNWAQEKSAGGAAEPKYVMAELQVVLTGPDGMPVVGARVMPYAMRMVEIDGHGFWDERKFGLPKNFVSNAEGIATIQYPATMEMGPYGKLTTKLVTFQVSHTDYVQQVVHCELGPNLDQPLTSIDVQLKKGCEVELAAVNANGERIVEFGILMAGPYGADIWEATEDGGRRTSAVNDGSWQTMLVAPQKDGPTLFSGLLPLRVRPSQAVRIRNVSLTPGTVLRGQLSNNVPRPVRHGIAITATAPKPAGSSYAEQNPSLVWQASVDINADGSFTLPSIPRSGKIQIIVVCDDFVSKTTIPESGPFVMGQLFDVEGSEMSVTVEMEPTASVEITVRQPDGSLLESGTVSASPNQKYYLGGSTIVGQRVNSLDYIQQQLLPHAERDSQSWFKRERNFPFFEQPIAAGVVTLRGLPAGAIGANTAGLMHEELSFPVAIGTDRGAVRYELKSGKVTKLEVTAVPHQQATAAQEAQAAELRAVQNIGNLLQKAVQAVQGK